MASTGTDAKYPCMCSLTGPEYRPCSWCRLAALELKYDALLAAAYALTTAWNGEFSLGGGPNAAHDSGQVLGKRAAAKALRELLAKYPACGEQVDAGPGKQ